MKIETIGLVTAMRGKMNKKQKLVFSERYGNTHAWEVNHSTYDPTANQLVQRQTFAAAVASANRDLADTAQRQQWEAVARASNGKYKTARGAAIAHYIANPDSAQE